MIHLLACRLCFFQMLKPVKFKISGITMFSFCVSVAAVVPGEAWAVGSFCRIMMSHDT